MSENTEHPLVKLDRYLELRATQLNGIVPKNVDAGRLKKIFLAHVSRDPKLLECTQESLYLALHAAAQVGMSIGSGQQARAYIIPYNNKKGDGKWVKEAQCQLSAQGLLQLVRNTGTVRKVATGAVFAGDHFEIKQGTAQEIIHEVPPELLGAENRVFQGAYAIAWLSRFDTQFVYLPKVRIEQLRKMSKSPDSSAWTGPGNYPEMAKTKALRALCKLLPMSEDDMSKISAFDEEKDVEGIVEETPRLQTPRSISVMPTAPIPAHPQRSEPKTDENPFNGDEQPTAEDPTPPDHQPARRGPGRPPKQAPQDQPAKPPAQKLPETIEDCCAKIKDLANNSPTEITDYVLSANNFDTIEALFQAVGEGAIGVPALRALIRLFESEKAKG